MSHDGRTCAGDRRRQGYSPVGGARDVAHKTGQRQRRRHDRQEHHGATTTEQSLRLGARSVRLDLRARAVLLPPPRSRGLAAPQGGYPARRPRGPAAVGALGQARAHSPVRLGLRRGGGARPHRARAPRVDRRERRRQLAQLRGHVDGAAEPRLRRDPAQDGDAAALLPVEQLDHRHEHLARRGRARSERDARHARALGPLPLRAGGGGGAAPQEAARRAPRDGGVLQRELPQAAAARVGGHARHRTPARGRPRAPRARADRRHHRAHHDVPGHARHLRREGAACATSAQARAQGRQGRAAPAHTAREQPARPGGAGLLSGGAHLQPEELTASRPGRAAPAHNAGEQPYATHES
mmetsp:Transcript_7774/g.19266  ORF Transcript_7774/g.19266 Transcript_7774/m.19266 type:complete len:354 (-) Transcript_7774:104-1165(-)